VESEEGWVSGVMDKRSYAIIQFILLSGNGTNRMGEFITWIKPWIHYYGKIVIQMQILVFEHGEYIQFVVRCLVLVCYLACRTLMFVETF